MEHLMSFYYPNSTGFTENDNLCKEILHNGATFRYCTFPGCGKIFRYKSESARHRLIHLPQKPFECPFISCRKTFKREDALKTHIRIHTGETPYKCEEPGCERSFSNKSGLRYHSLKHKGEKDFRCSFPACNKTFLTVTQLRSHEKTFNCHNKISTLVSPLQEVKELNLCKSEMQKCQDTFDGSIVPMRYAKELQWESNNYDDNVEEEKVSDDLKVEFERMVKTILKENNEMKKKLNLWNEQKGKVLENQGSESKSSRIWEVGNQGQSIPQESSEENIFAFLKFDNDSLERMFENL